MKCKRIKEIIITDYMDGELNEALTKQVEAHLNVCNECRAFEESLKKNVAEPFNGLETIRPADSVWEGIKMRIEEEQIRHEESGWAYLKNFLKPLFNIPKPVFVAISVIVFLVILTGSAVFFNSQVQLNNYFQEQQEFLDSLGNNSGNHNSTGSAGFGTMIEEYFL